MISPPLDRNNQMAESRRSFQSHEKGIQLHCREKSLNFVALLKRTDTI